MYARRQWRKRDPAPITHHRAERGLQTKCYIPRGPGPSAAWPRTVGMSPGLCAAFGVGGQDASGGSDQGGERWSGRSPVTRTGIVLPFRADVTAARADAIGLNRRIRKPRRGLPSSGPGFSRGWSSGSSRDGATDGAGPGKRL